MVALAHPDLEAHDVALHGAWPAVPAAEPGPTLLARTDEDFLAALLADLKTSDPQARIAASRPQPPAGANGLRLFQPVHRVFHLALLEAHCQAFGDPRLDPRKIESAGLVVRRIAADGSRHEGWMEVQGRGTGWQVLTNEDADPDPARRVPSRLTGDARFDATFRGEAPGAGETATSLFIATPDIAAATGRTLLYGLLPLTSDSRAGAVVRGAEPSRAEWEGHLSLLLRTTAARTLWPAGSTAERAATLERRDLTETLLQEVNDTTLNPARFTLLVQQLAQEFSLLRPVNAATAQALLAELNKLALPLVDGTARPAGDYLRSAAQFYFEQSTPVSALPRPQTWPAVSTAAAGQLSNLLRQIAEEVALSLAPANRGGRYDDPTSRYKVRAFLRLKCPHGCPPKLIWSAYSEPFSIAPWFEPSPVAPLPIILPDLADLLKNARPGVTFSVPRALAKVLNQNPKNFLEGKPGPGSDSGLDWICGFNIPIITLCAFVVLNIFLSLLNLVFWWLPFVKICIPFPRKR